MKKQISILAFAVFSAAVFVSFTSQEKKDRPLRNSPAIRSGDYTQAQIEKGKYLVEIMGCADCHAPKKMTAQGPIPDPDLGLSGHPAKIPMGKVVKTQDWVLFHPMNTIAVGPWGATFSANLTPAATGIGAW